MPVCVQGERKCVCVWRQCEDRAVELYCHYARLRTDTDFQGEERTA